LPNLQPPKKKIDTFTQSPCAVGIAGRCKLAGAPQGAPAFILHDFRPHGSQRKLKRHRTFGSAFRREILFRRKPSNPVLVLLNKQTLKAVNKTRHSGTQWLTLPDNNISKHAIDIKPLCAG